MLGDENIKFEDMDKWLKKEKSSNLTKIENLYISKQYQLVDPNIPERMACTK